MWASLTSIGPRKDHLKRAVTALLRQRNIELTGVVLTLPRSTHRPGLAPYTDADCDELAALSPLVRVYRPNEDLGPAMKYCGVEAALPQYHGPVFIGDDDQQYHPDLLQQLRHRLNRTSRPAVLQNRLETTRTCSKGGLIRGFAGLLLQAPFHLRGFTDFVRRAPAPCRVVDDDLYSLFLWLRGVPIERGVGRLDQIFINGAPDDDLATALHSTTPRASATAAVFAWGKCSPAAVQSPPPGAMQHWVSPFHLNLAFAGQPVVVLGRGVPGAAGQLAKALRASKQPVFAPECSAVIFIHSANDFGEKVRLYGVMRPRHGPLVLIKWPAHPRTIQAAAKRVGIPAVVPDLPAGDPEAPVEPIVMRLPKTQPLPAHACTVVASAVARTVLPSGRAVGPHGRGGIAVWACSSATKPQRLVQTGTVDIRDVHAVELEDGRVLVLLVGCHNCRPHVLLCDVSTGRTVPLVLRDTLRRRPRRQSALPTTGVRLFLHKGSPHCVVSYVPLCVLKVTDVARGTCAVLRGSVATRPVVCGGTPPIPWSYPRVAALACRGGEAIPVLLDCNAGTVTMPGNALPTAWGSPTQLIARPPDKDFELQCTKLTVQLKYKAVCALFSG